MRYEPHPRGLPLARQTIATYYEEHGELVDSEHLLLTASTSEAYAHLVRLLAEPGDEVFVPQPSYPLFDFLAQICDVRVVRYPLEQRTVCRIDRQALLAALSERTRAIIAVSPNNPTGTFLAHDDRDFLLSLCAERGLALIVDEVFADYRFNEDAKPLPWPAMPPALVFRLNGISKMLGLPQMKLAWICASGPMPLLTTALARLEVIADTFLSVNTPVQTALPQLFQLRPQIQNTILARIRINRTLLERLKLSSPWTLLPAQGGWYAVLGMPSARDEEEWALGLLEDEGIYVYPGYFFDFAEEPYLVLSLLPQPDRFAEGIARMAEHIRRASP
jgi:aspartate/methionine/tyrosine aminotransferase